jgi:hypothetical protein
MVTFGLTAVYLVFGLTLYVKGRQVHLDKGAHQAHKTAFFQVTFFQFNYLF